jgi:peptidoglycan/LPS O-acetylase OafA/YrhL
MKRNEVISFLQCFAIVLVVIGHSFVQQGFDLKKLLICGFHVQLFFSISGYLFMAGIEKYRSDGVWNFLRQKTLRLLWPYLFFSVLSFIVKATILSLGADHYSLRSVDISIGALIHSILYPSDNANIFLWFLFTLFAIFVVFGFVIQCYRFGKTAVNIALLFVFIYLSILFPPVDVRYSIMLLGYNNYAHNAVYFYLGMMFYNYRNYLFSCTKRVYLLLVIISLCFYVLLFFMPLSPVSYVLKRVSGILFGWSLALWVKGFSDKKIVRLIATYSYQVFLLSWFVHQAVIIGCYRMLGWNESLCFWLGLTGALGISVGIAFVTDRYVRSRFVRSLLGLK